MVEGPKDEKIDEAKMDGLLKRMLSTPPTPRKPTKPKGTKDGPKGR